MKGPAGLSYQLPQIRADGARQPIAPFDANFPTESAVERLFIKRFAVKEASSGVTGTDVEELSAGKCQSTGLGGGWNSLRSNILH